MSAIAEFTKYIVDAKYNDMPTNVVAATKKQILDTLGVTVAGSMSEEIRQLVDLVKNWGGKEESTILGYGGKAPLPDATFINGWSASVLDFDDFHDVDFVHASREMVPAALATAESIGAVTGKDFMVAIASGYNISCRMARAALVHRESGYLTATNCFGSAATAGKLMGLSEEQIRDAMGIALMQVSIDGHGIREGLNNKGIDQGFQGRAGVFAALMSAKGIEGSSDPIENSNFSFFNACHRGLYISDLLTEGLGNTYEILTVSHKPYPCCRFNHTAIKAALNLVNEYDIQPEDIEEVIVHHGPVADPMVKFRDKEKPPRNAPASQHTLPWAVASAIVYRKVGIENFTNKAIQDTRILEISKKITSRLVPEFAQIPVAEPAIVEVKMKDGKVYSNRVDIAPGDPKDPLSFEGIAEKFRYCCGFAAKPIPEENQDKVISMIANLEDVADVSEIASLLG